MKCFVSVLFIAAFLSLGQAQTTQSGTATVGSASGFPIVNLGKAKAGAFDESFSGTPDTVKIVISGCVTGGACDVLDTYTTAKTAKRTLLTTKAYDYFTVIPTLTGDAAATVTIKWTLK